MSRRRLLFAALASIASVARPVLADSRPVVAVFDIEDQRKKQKLGADVLEQMTAYLLAKMAESGVYKIVPREQVQAALAAQKKEAFKACYDEKCQIELGKELAAEKSLGTVILELGGRCVLTSTLYDLRTAVSERAATRKTPCDQAALIEAIDSVVAQIAPAGAGTAVAQPAKQVARAGCEGGRAGSCVAEARAAYEKGDKLRSLEFARAGCKLDDGASCSWVIKLEHERGELGAAGEAAAHACRDLAHGSSCSWAASIAYERKDKANALDYSGRGCELGDAEACAWHTKVQYELGNKARALEVGSRACNDMRHAEACSWAASIEYELGHRARALEFARRGCELRGSDACAWKSKLESESRR